MTTPHKATPEQWAATEEYANAVISSYAYSCILELRDRLTAAEQQIQKLKAASEKSSVVAALDHLRDATEMVATDEDLCRLVNEAQSTKSARRAIYDLGQQHGAANLSAAFTNSNYLAKPDSSFAPAVTRKPLIYPSAATIAECGGPCEQGFWHCDCGLLEKMNPDLSLQTQVSAGGLVDQVAKAIGIISTTQSTARAAILAVAKWLEEDNSGSGMWFTPANDLRKEINHYE